jgi:hypothetical protein
MLIDFTADGRALGVEITAPTRTTVTALNKVLRSLGVTPVERRDIAPLRRQSSACERERAVELSKRVSGGGWREAMAILSRDFRGNIAHSSRKTGGTHSRRARFVQKTPPLTRPEL